MQIIIIYQQLISDIIVHVRVTNNQVLEYITEHIKEIIHGLRSPPN